MLELLRSMIKEEWRIHSTMFGSFMFALFPLLVAVIGFAGTLLIPMFTDIMPIGQMIFLVHCAFVLFGLSIGGFGLMGREVMNRRFGHASLIAFSFRTLPVSQRNIFANFIVKDIIYYFFLWIVPFVLGFGAASAFMNISLGVALALLLTLSLSFMLGLSSVFLLTTIYAHSAKLLALVAVLLGVALYLQPISLPSYDFFVTGSMQSLSLAITASFILSALGIFFLKVDFAEKKRIYKNSFDSLAKRFSFFNEPEFMAKDFLDLKRSEGGLGKILFSFVLPVAFIWGLLYVFMRFFPQINLFCIFSILLGVISSTVYNWLTEFDIFASYSFLPVKVSNVIKSKISNYILFNVVSIPILLFAYYSIGSPGLLIPAAAAFLSIAAYALGVLIFLTGLHPNSMLYSAKIFFGYLAFMIPVLLATIFVSVLNPLYLLGSLVLFPIAILLIRAGFRKWDLAD